MGCSDGTSSSVEIAIESEADFSDDRETGQQKGLKRDSGVYSKHGLLLSRLFLTLFYSLLDRPPAQDHSAMRPPTKKTGFGSECRSELQVQTRVKVTRV